MADIVSHRPFAQEKLSGDLAVSKSWSLLPKYKMPAHFHSFVGRENFPCTKVTNGAFTVLWSTGHTDADNLKGSTEGNLLSTLIDSIYILKHIELFSVGSGSRSGANPDLLSHGINNLKFFFAL